MRREPLLALVMVVLFSVGPVAADSTSSLADVPRTRIHARLAGIRFDERKSESGLRGFDSAAADPRSLPFKLPVVMSPAAAPPDLAADQKAPAPGPLPLLPLAAALGLAAYEVSRSRGAYASDDGLDDEHPKPVGFYQRLVAGAILAGAAGALVYTLGAAVVSAAPVALNYAANVGAHGLRLAGSEAGAINPGELGATNEVPHFLARVIAYSPGQEIPHLLGIPGKTQAFVTAAEDIEGLTAQELETKLGILPSLEYLVIRFPTPPNGLATPIDHVDPQFVGEGLTNGGLREFWIPNGPVPPGATFEIVK